MLALRRIFKFLCLGFSLTSLAITAAAKPTPNCDTLNIAAARIPHYIEDENTGIFINLVSVAAKYAGLKLEITVLPKKRALQQFVRGQANTLLPHSSAGENLNAYKSDAILVKRDFAFVRRGNLPPKSVEEMKGMRVGLTSQYAYPKWLTERTDIDFTSQAESDQMNIRMLVAGRYDVAIIEQKSGSEAVSKIARDQIVYDPRYPISELNVWVLFQKDECGAMLKQKIDTAMRKMKTDGSWESIFQDLPESS
ncbi:MAG: transporter substrate-binding domain-containing protein [Sneathiella sp.]|nr:transporter substrate-binding domain-containing protein [Sneathiella sp.]